MQQFLCNTGNDENNKSKFNALGITFACTNSRFYCDVIFIKEIRNHRGIQNTLLVRSYVAKMILSTAFCL